jgi:hypothetical protein
MPNTINADNGVSSGITGIRTTADSTGNLALQSNGVTVLTLATNNTATFSNNVTITGTLTATGGVVVGASAAPAFSAYLSSAQTITNNTSTKIALNTEAFDTNSNYDTTNYRFTPTVAGYYQINGTVYFSNPNVYNAVFIFKNGSRYRTGVQAGNGAYSYGSTVSDIVFMNGTTDYIELYCYQLSGSSQGLVTDFGTNYMSGCLVRGA